MQSKMKCIHPVLVVFLTAGLLVRLAVAQDDVTWVTVEGKAAMEQVSKEEARKRAVEDALQRAREKIAGDSISVESLAVNFKLSGGIAASIPYIKVVDKTVLEEGVSNAPKGGASRSETMYRVLLKAGVVEERTGIDPAFQLESSLNRTTFSEGDEMQLRIKSTKDCHVSVFTLMEDGKVLRLLPNRFRSTLFLKAGENFVFPSEKDKKNGVKLVVHLPDNNAGNEALYVLALNRPFSYNADRFQEGIYGVYDGNTAFMNDLVREIIGIPLKDRAEKLIQYQIKKDKGGNQ